MNWFQILLLLVFAHVVFSSHLCHTCAYGDYHMVNSFLLESTIGKAMNITNKTECHTHAMPVSQCAGLCVQIHVHFERYGKTAIGSIQGCSSDMIATDPHALPRHTFVSPGEEVVFDKKVENHRIKYNFHVNKKLDIGVLKDLEKKPRSLNNWIALGLLIALAAILLFLFCCFHHDGYRRTKQRKARAQRQQLVEAQEFELH